MWSTAAVISSVLNAAIPFSESSENLFHCIFSLMSCGTTSPFPGTSRASASSSFFSCSISSLVARLLDGTQRRPVKRSNVSPTFVKTPRTSQSAEIAFFGAGSCTVISPLFKVRRPYVSCSRNFSGKAIQFKGNESIAIICSTMYNIFGMVCSFLLSYL